MPEPKAKELKTACPECDTETTIIIDDEGDYEGNCPNCKINVGRILTKRRYSKAMDRLAERETAESKKSKKKFDPFS